MQSNNLSRGSLNVSNATEQRSEFFDFNNANNRRSFILLAVGALIGLGIAGYGLFTAAGTATNTVPAEYVALVNQRAIYRSDYVAQIQTTFSVPYEQATPEQRHQVVEDMINEELLVQRGLEVDLASYDPDVRNALVGGVELQMYADVLAKQPTDAELKAYYEQHKDKYASLGMMQLRDLMLNVVQQEDAAGLSKRAADAVAALRNGMSADDAIKKFQLRDSGLLQQSGKPELGDIFDFAAEANLPAKVYKAASKLKPGEVSEPIAENEGTHVVVMIDRKQSQPRDFETVRSNVWTDIKNAEQDKIRRQTLTYFRNKSEILRGQE
jgi:parvulin-like peptidyl-prolyl isomerase